MTTGGAEKVVLITGVTDAVGAAFAAELLARNCRVAATVQAAWQVDRVRQQLSKDRLLVGVVAPTDSEAAAGFVKGAEDSLGPIDVFVAAAGLVRAIDPGREPAGDLQEQLASNLLLNTTVARAVLPAMRRRNRGVLAFIGLPGAAQTASLSATCRASKAAVVAFADALAIDLSDTGVVVRQLVVPIEDPVAEQMSSLADSVL